MYIDKANTIVIKIGSSNIVDGKGKLKEKWLKSLVKDIKKLVNKDKKIVIVSSGAIALGQSYLKIKQKNEIRNESSFSFIGQIHLTNVYRKMFERGKIKIGQILISLR